MLCNFTYLTVKKDYLRMREIEKVVFRHGGMLLAAMTDNLFDTWGSPTLGSCPLTSTCCHGVNTIYNHKKDK